MTFRLVVLFPLIALTLMACGKPAPPEAAEAAAASAPASGNRHGLSPDVATAADELFTYVEANLLGNSVREPATGEARRRLAALRTRNQTAADRSVTLLIAMLMSKDGQRAG